ncbi:DUF6916 family protein [Brevibacillus sp. 179-C9.3 HS]|uniref:DUF6916 family protein n=1 Tax=unclassified Brevibacillus TaxID=2684853 RepID=UPI0039A0A3F7
MVIPTYVAFLEQVNTAFQVPLPAPYETIEISLQEANEREDEMFSSFTLLFQGPVSVQLEQGTYALSHPTLGEVFLFLVPVMRTPQGFQYEAVINRYK